MSPLASVLKSYRQVQEAMSLFADAAFRKARPDAEDETARGEFISAYITESGLDLPQRSERRWRPRG